MIKNFFQLIFILFLFPLLVTAQTQQGTYLKIDYLKVDQNQSEEFKNQVQSDLREHFLERISSDEIKSWALYRILFPGSDAMTYNYLSVTASASIDAFDNINFDHTDPISDKAAENLFDLPLSELWVVRNSVVEEISDTPSNFLQLDYMDVRLGRELEYQMLEDEVAKPLHEERMSQDIMEGWEMYELITPGGMHYGYNFATGNYFSRLEHIEYGFNEELIRSQNPNVDLMEFFEHIWSTRDLVRSEIWQRVDYATGEYDDE